MDWGLINLQFITVTCHHSNVMFLHTTVRIIFFYKTLLVELNFKKFKPFLLLCNNKNFSTRLQEFRWLNLCQEHLHIFPQSAPLHFFPAAFSLCQSYAKQFFFTAANLAKLRFQCTPNHSLLMATFRFITSQDFCCCFVMLNLIVIFPLFQPLQKLHEAHQKERQKTNLMAAFCIMW